MIKYLFLLFLAILPANLFAQDFYFNQSLEESAIIEIIPSIPSPRENVAATVKSNLYTDLSKSEIIWQINGEEMSRGIGETTFSFQAPEIGKNLELFATVNSGESNTFAGFINIQTANLDLVYEANTYIPPFYKGRSVFVPQSEIRLAAIATLVENGSPISKDKIIYKWYRENTFLSSVSGAGKDSISIPPDTISRPFSISVEVESLNSQIKAKKRVSLSPKEPKVVLYENNPILGSVFEKALTGTFNFDREEVGITAVPYFFSTENRDSESLKYSWYENGKEINPGALGSFINYLNPNKEKSGLSKLKVKIENNTNFLQSSDNNFQMNVLGNQQSDTIETNESIAF